MAPALLERLSPPSVTLLVCFLAFSSQWLFYRIEPGPLGRSDAYTFNSLIFCLLICYWRTCFTDPGRIPKDWIVQTHGVQPAQRQRWCRKCEAYKPSRAHHCKTCQRCIMKMDHHCVWTANCVSHITLPHFVRFIIYAVVSMVYLESLLYRRVALLWHKRHLPSYLGPGQMELAHMFILVTTNSLVLFMLTLLLIRTLWSLSLNMTTIEGWEVERHEAVLRRARTLGGYLDGPDGYKVRIEHQEFPWDIGIWTNICDGMGSRNPIAWFWPFASSPTVPSGLTFVHNGIDDPRKPWPPPDPDRMFRASRVTTVGDDFLQITDVDKFRERQAADFARYEDADGDYVVRRRPFHERLEDTIERDARRITRDDEDEVAIHTDDTGTPEPESPTHRPPRRRKESGGEEAWRNREGERLQDFGVDEVADFYDEDDLPLAQLQQRLQAAKHTSTAYSR